jgi:hypothetical protein
MPVTNRLTLRVKNIGRRASSFPYIRDIPCEHKLDLRSGSSTGSRDKRVAQYQ